MRGRLVTYFQLHLKFSKMKTLILILSTLAFANAGVIWYNYPGSTGFTTWTGPFSYQYYHSFPWWNSFSLPYNPDYSKFELILNTYTQCGNLAFFLPFRFYVKSIGYICREFIISKYIFWSSKF